MGGRSTLEIVIVVGGLGIYGLIGLSKRWRMRAAVVRALDVVDFAAVSDFRGRKRGRYVSVNLPRMLSRGPEWTYVACELPDRPFQLVLWEQAAAPTRWRRGGRVVDVEVGDPAFDEKWIVEGAPADVVRRVLTSAVRKQIMDLLPNELEQPAPNVLRLRVRDLPDPVWVVDAIETMVTIAESIEPAFETSDAEAIRHAEWQGAPYRGDIRPMDVEAARQREFEQLGQARKRRSRGVMINWILAAAVGGGLLLLRWLMS